MNNEATASTTVSINLDEVEKMHSEGSRKSLISAPQKGIYVTRTTKIKSFLCCVTLMLL